MTAQVYIGLGSNLDEPIQQIQAAIRELAQLADSQLLVVSPLYLSKPMGPRDQPDYVNAVACLSTDLSALALLDALQVLEQKHKRVRSRRWGARTLDLDILLFAQQQIATARLTVPHIGITERNFVLYPLFDIAPDLLIPGFGKIAALLKQVSADGIEKLSVSED